MMQKARTRKAEAVASRDDFVMERFGDLRDADRSFDVEFWQRQGDAAIFQAAWELAEFYHQTRGMTPDELRLQRSVEHFERT
jgi:hypothetical protein